MVFTVSVPGGIRDDDFPAFVRILEKDGVNIAHLPRVPDPVTGKRWLHAWDNRAAAERFAERVREASENPRWQVYELPDAPSIGPLGPIEIVACRQSEGCNYGLDGISEKLVRRRFPQAKQAPGVFVEMYTGLDFEATQGPIWDQVAIILTGLPIRLIDELGGYRVYDQKGKRVLREAPPLVRDGDQASSPPTGGPSIEPGKPGAGFPANGGLPAAGEVPSPAGAEPETPSSPDGALGGGHGSKVLRNG